MHTFFTCILTNFFAIRSSILERCILKISTANVAVGTEDLDEIKRSALCFLKCVGVIIINESFLDQMSLLLLFVLDPQQGTDGVHTMWIHHFLRLMSLC